MTVVLDSWAVLRYLEGVEPLSGRVGKLLDEELPLMSWINLGEVHDVLRRAHGEAAAVETIRDLFDVVDAQLPDVQLVLAAARIKADHPMAVADAFGAALAVVEHAELWTGDPELLINGATWRWLDLRELG